MVRCAFGVSVWGSESWGIVMTETQHSPTISLIYVSMCTYIYIYIP